ncbi:mutS domain V domain-containing protein [Trichoderma breve]|uniref:MutS domain V domain-containing protein n=1 Tax=Trichoderma breve TaxID=2034170 RepID=A0A9W9BK50_9HYPO|nr:mutS domain V domain-containing protein [Trichoderma breve]KAJ4861026.1 mutS domain V domain-containing protein [Trichoderma breve]
MLRQRTVYGFWSRPLYARRSSAPALRVAFALPLTTAAHLQAAAKPAKRTRTTVKLSDLPQGKIAASPLALEEQNGPAYPTVILQARRHMDKFENCVLLTRVGGFYELYFEHAEEYATHFGIKLAFKKTTAGPVPMAGFRYMQLDKYLKILVQDLNRHVAIAEEFPNDASEKIKSGGLMHNRRVTRIITPGTLIDENFIDPYANNYIMAIHVPQNDLDENSTPIGLAWLDLSTGQFFTQSATLSSLPAILSRIAPREVVLEQSFESRKDHDVFSILTDDRHLVTFSPDGGLVKLDDWAPYLESEMSHTLQTSFTDDEIIAGGLALNYVRNRLQETSMKLQPPQRYGNMQTMTIDKNSLRALEIKQTIRDGFFRGSLLHAIRRTVTKSGARLLNEWLGSPSTSLEVIKARQDLVARFKELGDLRDSLVVMLRLSDDCQRLVQRFALGRASRIELEEPLKLAHRIQESIDEEGIAQQQAAEDSEAEEAMTQAQNIASSEGFAEDIAALTKGKRKKRSSIKEEQYGEDNRPWIMKPTASKELQSLHDDLASLLKDKTTLGEEFCERFKAPSLTLKWAPTVGHIAHIKGKDAKNLAQIKMVSSSRSTRSFQLDEWTALGQRLEQVTLRIRREEQRVFQALREQVVKNFIKLRHIAAVLDEIDIATSFAKIANEQNLVRPTLTDSRTHIIMGGRHPTVEGGLLEQGRRFTRNDCIVGPSPNGLIWFITGPNMAGKSTFLRQNALITVMAQIGCYVPASHAEIGIVDAIFSRVGSADSLYHDQSTFMVEMLETAQILRQATPRSFVIMDEIGRGTTPEDGTAIAFACLHHLVTVNQCRTLFATHFHDVADMAAAEGFCHPKYGPVRTYCTDVKENEDGSFVYVHKLRPGVNRQSHALKVAHLAGIPQRAIDIARNVLDAREAKEKSSYESPVKSFAN